MSKRKTAKTVSVYITQKLLSMIFSFKTLTGVKFLNTSNFTDII